MNRAGCASGFAEDWAEWQADEATCRMPMPVYKTPRGEIAKIAGRAAETWPHPRVYVHDDGATFVERPMPCDTGWGITYHTSANWNRGVIGEFLAQYVEGRASGFPPWPTVYFATRVVGRRLRRLLALG